MTLIRKYNKSLKEAIKLKSRREIAERVSQATSVTPHRQFIVLFTAKTKTATFRKISKFLNIVYTSFRLCWMKEKK